jgi:hypothetical protein
MTSEYLCNNWSIDHCTRKVDALATTSHVITESLWQPIYIDLWELFNGINAGVCVRACFCVYVGECERECVWASSGLCMCK